jgi:carbon monoxide dehydrogenase subunit G
MLKIIGVILAVVVLAIAIVAIYAATKPDSFSVQRSVAIKAPPEKILAIINDFHGWGVWSPYENKDPAMKRTYSGAPSGKGAIYAWEGNSKVGQGRMEILDVTPSKTIIKLDFIKPFEGHNTAEFTAAPQGDATTVTWAMHGPARFITKLMGTFFNLDKMIGDDFEAGLANLKAAAEK